MNTSSSANKWTHLDNTSEAKVSNLHNVVITNENISCGEVTVDVVLRLEVCHATCYLRCYVNQLRQLQRPTSTCQLCRTNVKKAKWYIALYWKPIVDVGSIN